MNNTEGQKQRRHFRDGNNQWIGIIFLFIGGAFMLRYIGVGFPTWIFSWEILLIAIGLFIGMRESFRGLTWVILIGIGSFFLIDDFLPDLNLNRLILPLVFIGIGLSLVFRTRKNKFSDSDSLYPADNPSGYDSESNNQQIEKEGIFTKDSGTDNILDIASIFANVRKVVLSKNFKGGEIVSIFGGAEINLNNADMKTPVIIETVNVFGGTKLYIPNNWEIKSEVVAIFGGIEDKRRFPSITVVPDRTLILKGFCMFGGLEIKSF